jgi:hypothetical protein
MSHLIGRHPNSDPTSLVVSSRLRRSSRATPCRSVPHQAGLELGATIAAFEATDFDRLDKFVNALSTPIDHVLVTGPGPYYAPLAEFDLEAALREQLGGQSLAGRDAAFSWAALVAAARRRASISCRHSQLRFPP